MQTLTCTIDTTTGALRFDRPLYLGATYNVTTSGATARVVLCDCNGDPVAASDPEGLSGHVFALDTAELLALFRRAGIAGSPGCVVVHAWCYDESGDAIAQSDIPVFYSPLVDADGVLTKIDTKGAKGDKGEPGKDGPNFVTFAIDENGHLIATANSPLDLYADGDENKPRWKLGDGEDGTTAGHLYYVIYNGDGDARHLDVGTVKGEKGDDAIIPNIDTEPTEGSGGLVRSGGVFLAIQAAERRSNDFTRETAASLALRSYITTDQNGHIVAVIPEQNQ